MVITKSFPSMHGLPCVQSSALLPLEDASEQDCWALKRNEGLRKGLQAKYASPEMFEVDAMV